jgi:hypothetical protein
MDGNLRDYILVVLDFHGGADVLHVDEDNLLIIVN